MSHYSEWMRSQTAETMQVVEAVHAMTDELTTVAERMADRFRKGGKAYFFGNGGSAADAQHWAAELTGRFYLNRPSLPAFSLVSNVSQVTALANDFDFDEIFSRPLEGLAGSNDMAIGISTSGRSANVLRGLAMARSKGALTVGFTGALGDSMQAHCDFLIRIPAEDVARIQEGHVVAAHLVCAAVEQMLFGQEH